MVSNPMQMCLWMLCLENWENLQINTGVQRTLWVIYMTTVTKLMFENVFLLVCQQDKTFGKNSEYCWPNQQDCYESSCRSESRHSFFLPFFPNSSLPSPGIPAIFSTFTHFLSKSFVELPTLDRPGSQLGEKWWDNRALSGLASHLGVGWVEWRIFLLLPTSLIAF